jgi:hypothetical protein
MFEFATEPLDVGNQARGGYRRTWPVAGATVHDDTIGTHNGDSRRTRVCAAFAAPGQMYHIRTAGQRARCARNFWRQLSCRKLRRSARRRAGAGNNMAPSIVGIDYESFMGGRCTQIICGRL